MIQEYYANQANKSVSKKIKRGRQVRMISRKKSFKLANKTYGTCIIWLRRLAQCLGKISNN